MRVGGALAINRKMTIEQESLEGNKADTWAAITKGAFGAVPVAGSLLSEIVGSIIPNQRLDRVCKYLLELDKRLTKVEIDQLKQNTLALDLFEDSAVIASRALTEVRNQYVASFMKSVVSINATEYDLKKKLLYILQDLTDRDIDILQSIKGRGYQRTVSENYPRSISNGAFSRLTKEEKIEYRSKQEVWLLHIATLERSGLLIAHREAQNVDNSHGHIDPETGLPRVRFYEISTLGNIFLSLISN